MIGKQIREITPQGILYTDENGEEKSVDFTECFETFLRWSLSAYTTTPRGAGGYRKWKLIGDINYYGDLGLSEDEADISNPPYIEFHDKPGTRFEFESAEECRTFHERIMEMGWNLFDVSD